VTGTTFPVSLRSRLPPNWLPVAPSPAKLWIEVRPAVPGVTDAGSGLSNW